MTRAEREAARRLAERYRCAFVDLREQRIDPELFRSIPAEMMFRYNFVPLEAMANTLVVAMADPSQLQLTDELSLLLGKRLQIKVATASQIGDLLKRTEQSQRVLDQATEGFTLQVVSEEEDSDENISMEKLTRDTGVSPVVRLVDTVIFTALERRASDIHIETRNSEVVVKYRIDGVLAVRHAAARQGVARHDSFAHQGNERTRHRRTPRPAGRPLPRALQRPLRRFPRFDHALGAWRRRRASRARQGNAQRKIPQPHARCRRFRPGRSYERFRRYIHEPYGMVLVTGPTGSGKTTTLYAAINEIKNDEDKIITIEDPVEYQVRGITQIPVNEKRASRSPAACVPFCVTTPTRSWSAKFATRKPRRSPSTRRSPAIWFSPRFTPTT